MDLNTAVVIWTYPDEMSARLAQIKLGSSGIETVIHADDCGGSLAGLVAVSNAKLLVGASDREEAIKILRQIEQGTDEEGPVGPL